MTAATTRVRGFAEWAPRRKSLELFGQVKCVLAEYDAYLPMTISRIFCRLVGDQGYDKTERAYAFARCTAKFKETKQRSTK